jgi:acetyl esterase/lipase
LSTNRLGPAPGSRSRISIGVSGKARAGLKPAWRGLHTGVWDNTQDTVIPGFDFPAFLKWCDDESKHARLHRRCNLDVSYGHGPAKKLDIFPAEGINSGRVEIFLHGGYWRLLDKINFSYVANGLAPHGVTSVIVNYGLIPNVTMAELVDQCRAAVAWTYRHIAEYGGDPEQLYVSGHSAGGRLIAMMMATDWQLYGFQRNAHRCRWWSAVAKEMSTCGKHESSRRNGRNTAWAPQRSCYRERITSRSARNSASPIAKSFRSCCDRDPRLSST